MCLYQILKTQGILVTTVATKKCMITLKGNPLSTNSIYRAGKGFYYMTIKGKELKRDYQIQAKQQWKKQPLTTQLSVAVDLFFGDKRKRDIDNYNKLIFDALSGIVWVDDVQIEELVIKKGIDKSCPRIEIDIIEIE